MNLKMSGKEREDLLHQLLNMGENMLSCGGEVSRVEGTLVRMGYAYGASRMNVFVITSSMVITMSYPDREEYTQTRRLSDSGSTDFEKLEAYNELSREVCKEPVPVEELRSRIKKTQKDADPSRLEMYLGCMLAAGAFAIFFDGGILDGIVAGICGLLVRFLQEKIAPYCSGKMIYHVLTAFISGLVIGLLGSVIPGIHLDKILIGDIMLMIPGIAMTSSVRDVFVGDTIAGLLRLVETLLWAAALAAGIMLALTLIRLIPSAILFSQAITAAVPVAGSAAASGTRLSAGTAIVQLITGALGSLGFSMMFHLRKKLMVWTAIGGIVCWGIYILFDSFTPGVFLACLAASAVCGFYGEILARMLKVPATILFIPTMVPLIPGGSLYYTMAATVQSEWSSASFYAGRTIQYVLAIAIGISLVWAFYYMLRMVKTRRNGT
ncbi:MAG: threonine/serine exporter family protein [Firmicutes bacterium]|nr:threonine/serine exporter family protein [Bacillota bacterium]